MKISVIGAGYVGLSLITLLSKWNKVMAIDIDEKKIELMKAGISPLKDAEIEGILNKRKNNIDVSMNLYDINNSDFVIISTSTNYDSTTSTIDTSSVDLLIKDINEISPESTIVIKSTVPIGYTLKKYGEGFTNVMFSPEFLREGKALYDNLHPSRIIVGIPSEELVDSARAFASLLSDAADEGDIPVLIMNSTEAESVKLFSNTYLAMRIAFFNELDTFAEINGLDSKLIINGVCKDYRIGDYYNNPSFGYGGYCLPKDTKQLLSEYSGTPNELMGSIVKSNLTRMNVIANNVMKKLKGRRNVGIYRIVMKQDSDNYRESSVLEIAKLLKNRGIRILIYEPLCNNLDSGYQIVFDFNKFIEMSDIIIANRLDNNISIVPKEKVYSRDLFFRD